MRSMWGRPFRQKALMDQFRTNRVDFPWTAQYLPGRLSPNLRVKLADLSSPIWVGTLGGFLQHEPPAIRLCCPDSAHLWQRWSNKYNRRLYAQSSVCPTSLRRCNARNALSGNPCTSISFERSSVNGHDPPANLPKPRFHQVGHWVFDYECHSRPPEGISLNN